MGLGLGLGLGLELGFGLGLGLGLGLESQICALGEAVLIRPVRPPVLAEVVRDVTHARGAREALRRGEAA